MADDNKKKTLVLVDGHSNVHKAYHAIREQLTNSRGEPTSAVYGFLNSFMRLMRDVESPHVVVVFDPPGGSFRDEMYPDYKANRPPMPEDLRKQDARIRQLLAILKVPVLELPGFEADDALAALAIRAVENGGEALVCSVDKDLLQIVRPGIRIWREHLQKLEILDESGVFEKLGVKPDQVATYLGLVGDSADNIPGVPGVGAKTASALLQQYGTLEAILAAAPTLSKKKIAESLQENADKAFLSRDLATLRTDCVAHFDWDGYHWTYQPSEELRAFYQEMEFHSLLKELGGPVAEAKPRTTDYQIVRTTAQLQQVVAEIQKAGLCAIDTETTGLDTLTADLVGISLSWKPDVAVYIPIGHSSREQAPPLSDVHRLLDPLLTDKRIQWVAHHWGYDCKILRRAGFHGPVVAGDTMIASYLLNPDRQGGNGLKVLAQQLLGIQMTRIDQLIGEDDLVTMASVDVEEAGRYACQDADATLQLHLLFTPKLESQGLIRLYREVELPLINVLSEMELEGVRINSQYFAQLSREADKQLIAMAEEIIAMAGRRFNINSPKQVGEVLFEDLKLPSGKKGKSGAYSTDVSVLESLSDKHPLPAKLLEYRQVEKLKNTYIDPLPLLVAPSTGRVHTSYNQTVAATGRLSSSNPNLQNIPIRTEAGRAIRQGFVPRSEGWRLLAADYSQIELRILAHLSGDAALIEAFTSGGDIHSLTASKIFGLPLGEVTKAQRGQAKAINFGIIYGMSDFRLSNDLGLSRDAAKKFIEDYFRIYSGVRDFIETTKAQAHRDGFVTTLLGRRRYLADINSSNFNSRATAERIAVNTPIQGTSADMIKLAMLRVAEAMRAEGMAARMILQVHDELIFDAPEAEIDRLSTLVKKTMSEALPLKVPLQVDVETGSNWAEC